MKNFFKNDVMLIVIIITSFATQQAAAQQREYYERARDLYKQYALKTACAERAKYLNAMAEYNDCLAKRLGPGGASLVCNKPAGDVPPCSGDMIGNDSKPANTARPVTSAATSLNSNATSTAFENTYNNSVNSGKKTSGALLDATFESAKVAPDANTANAALVTGSAISFLAYLGERKEMIAEQKAKEEAFNSTTNDKAEDAKVGETYTANTNAPVRYSEDADGIIYFRIKPEQKFTILECFKYYYKIQFKKKEGYLSKLWVLK